MQEIVFFNKIKFHLIFLYLLLNLGNCGDVLMMQPFSSKSHKILFDVIAHGLSVQGHNTTLVTVFKSKNEHRNVTEIIVRDLVALHRLRSDCVIESGTKGISYNLMRKLANITGILCDDFFQSGPLHEWEKQGRRFDAIIVDAVYHECLLSVSHLFSPTIIILNTAFLFPFTSIGTNIPSPYSFVSSFVTPYTSKMTFYQRVVNIFSWEQYQFYLRWLVYPSMEKATRKHFPQMKSIDQSYKDVSLVLANQDSILSTPRPAMPLAVEIGGFHCRPGKPLPKDLSDFADSADEPGFVFFSLGTIVEDLLTKDQVEAFIKAFIELKYKVIWKYPKTFDNLPNNIKKITWAPQNDILAHPKICAFITHSGLLSTQEAVYNQVPMVTLPVFADQPQNAAYMAELGISQPLYWNSLTVENIKKAIEKACNDPDIKIKTREISRAFRDLPEPRLEKAIFWIEYVIRHQGMPHNHSYVHELYLHQYFLLDAIAFLGIIIFVIGFIIFLMIRSMLVLYNKRKLKTC